MEEKGDEIPQPTEENVEPTDEKIEDAELADSVKQDEAPQPELDETKKKARLERFHNLFLKAQSLGLNLTEEQIAKAHTSCESTPMPNKPTYEMYRIHIVGFPLNMNELQIIDFLSQFGEVYDLYMLQLPNGKFRGMVKVTFLDNPDIDGIVEKISETVYHSTRLHACRALSKEGREQYKRNKYGVYAGHPEKNKDYYPTVYDPRTGKMVKVQNPRNFIDPKDMREYRDRPPMRDGRDYDRNPPPRRDYRDDDRPPYPDDYRRPYRSDDMRPYRDPRDYPRDYYRDPRDYAEDPRDGYGRDPRDSYYDEYARRSAYDSYYSRMGQPADPQPDYSAYYYQPGYY